MDILSVIDDLLFALGDPSGIVLLVLLLVGILTGFIPMLVLSFKKAVFVSMILVIILVTYTTLPDFMYYQEFFPDLRMNFLFNLQSILYFFAAYFLGTYFALFVKGDR